MPDDDDEEASGEAKRQFGSTPRTAWQEWEAFCERVETGKAAPSCVIDFAYTDGGNLRGPETQLERCICFHDAVSGDPDEILVVVHVHTTEKWVNRKKLSSGRRLDRITSVNARPTNGIAIAVYSGGTKAPSNIRPSSKKPGSP